MDHPAEAGSGRSWAWAQARPHAASPTQRPIQFAYEHGLLPRGLMAITDESGQVVGAMRRRRRIRLEEANRRALRCLTGARFNGPEIAMYVDARRAERIPRLVLRLGRSGSTRRAPRRPRSPRVARRSAAKPKPPDDPPPEPPPSPPQGRGRRKARAESRVGFCLATEGLLDAVGAPVLSSAGPYGAAWLAGLRFARHKPGDDQLRPSRWRGSRGRFPSADPRGFEPEPVPSGRAAGHVPPRGAS
jgi:hypothetical protein